MPRVKFTRTASQSYPCTASQPYPRTGRPTYPCTVHNTCTAQHKRP